MAIPFVDSDKCGRSSTVENPAGIMKYAVFIVLMAFIGAMMISDGKMHALLNMLHAMIGFIISSDSRNISSAEISVNCEIHFKLLIDGVWTLDLHDLSNDDNDPKITNGFFNYW